MQPPAPRYVARVLRGVTVGPSPDWLRRRLATVGQQSVNNVVDATNYAMLETGQPFHAFDLARLRGGRIVVRAARPGETFKALNQKETGEEHKARPDDARHRRRRTPRRARRRDGAASTPA